MKHLFNPEAWNHIHEDISSCMDVWKEDGLDPSLVAYIGIFRFTLLAMEYVDPKDLDMFLATSIESAKRFKKEKGVIEYDG
tara:strand:+ start:5975 stop:6217 length:243 start_codon:yes stop_codon:yes gene_type:complete